MNPGEFSEMLDAVQREQYAVDSILVIQHGKTLVDAYFYPYGPEHLHDLRSIAKTMTSILTGIAIDKGIIDGVETRALDLFPGRTFAHLDERKERITLKHLLTMTSGLDWLDERDMGALFGQQDWVRFVFDKPMAVEPGTRMQYATGPVHLIAAAVQQAAGVNLLDFAQEHLFKPLGIQDMYWMTDPQGIPAGGMGVFLKPRDMAKIGQLFLHKGQWNGQQIVSPAWVEASTTVQVLLKDSPDDTDYGYLWWLDRRGTYRAIGYAGQMIYVLPDQDAVAVFTGRLKDGNLARVLLDSYILPALTALSASSEGESGETLRGVFGKPDPQPVKPLPEIAGRISGQAYSLGENVFGWQTITLRFVTGTGTALVSIDGQPDVPLGLDGVFRVTPGGKFIHWLPESFPTVLEGCWESEDTFAIRYRELGVPEPHNLRLTFRESAVEIEAVEMLNVETTRFSGAAQ